MSETLGFGSQRENIGMILATELAMSTTGWKYSKLELRNLRENKFKEGKGLLRGISTFSGVCY